ncbi:hypothetical protein LWI28_025305 [Acer negundo]|uniref:Uncharacterized protein n=1 Tax=Acer negundo TaxID=4023 RepID=A0AAD5J7N7_ACENE|nr:hypothetical protein LWI28_025305 [Acer negundo]
MHRKWKVAYQLVLKAEEKLKRRTTMRHRSSVGEKGLPTSAGDRKRGRRPWNHKSVCFSISDFVRIDRQIPRFGFASPFRICFKAGSLAVGSFSNISVRATSTPLSTSLGSCSSFYFFR